MTKSTITREESIQAVFDLKVGYTLGLADIEILKRVARMALVAMDSEPVAIIDQANLDYLRSGADADVWPPEREEMEDVLLYRHAQPAPAVEPVRRFNADQMHRICLEANRHLDKYGAMAKEVNKLLGRIPAQPAQPLMFIDGDISSESADKLAKVIREFNDEDERPLAKMARIIRENPHPTNECDMPKAQPAPERDQVRREHAEWSKTTFGNVGPVGPLKHLSKEALEAAAEPDDLSEWADMQFLLWDAQRRAGITDEQITHAMIEKLAINKQREWPEPKDGEPRLHIKEQPAPVVPDTWPRKLIWSHHDDISQAEVLAWNDAIDACRAAMLNGGKL